MRRKALILVYFVNPNQDPARVTTQKFRQTYTREFLIASDRKSKRPGFLELPVKISESVPSAIRRFSPWSEQAIVHPWQELTRFQHQGAEIIVGHVGVGEAQRRADFYEQLGEQTRNLPILVGWYGAGWLRAHAEDDLLNVLSSTAFAKLEVRHFVEGSKEMPQAA